MASYHIDCVVVVSTIDEDELDLVVVPETLQVIPTHPVRHIRARALYVQHRPHPLVHVHRGYRPRRLQGHQQPLVAESPEQLWRRPLKQWLATSYQHVVETGLLGLGDERIDLNGLSATTSPFGVAISAAELTAGEPNEPTAVAKTGRLALNRGDDLCDVEAHR